VPSAVEVVELARQDIETVADRLRHHPYVEAVEAGTLPRTALERFAGEQWHIIQSDLRSVAHLVTRYGDTSAGQFFLDTLAGERAALEALGDFGLALGKSEDDLRRYEPQAGAHAYTCYMAWLGLYGSAAEVAAAYLVNFPAWGENCGRLSHGLRRHYGMTTTDVAFFDLFAAGAPGFDASALAVIERGLQTGADPAHIRRAARLLQAYEIMYWDTLHASASG
jgi:thiaminase